MTGKLLTLDDLEGQQCNRNYIDCSASSLAIAGLSCKNKQHSILVALCKTKIAVSGSELFTE